MAIPEHITKLIKIFVDRISLSLEVTEVYVFGSTARGERLAESDIDIVLVSKRFRGMTIEERLSFLYKEWFLNSKMMADIIPLTPEEFKDRLSESVVMSDASKYWVRIV